MQTLPRRIIITACFILAVRAQERGLTPGEIRGRTIYRDGRNASGKDIVARVSGGEVSGMSCASCHGNDGRGRPEGGVTPPKIRWEDLKSDRPHGAYNETLLVRAIAMGIDPAGNRLGDVMPRFSLSRADADDLIAYLKKISVDHDPGISDDVLRIGSMPGPGEEAVRAALTAYLAGINQSGGIYGRRIELTFGAPPNVADFLAKQPLFALLDVFIAGAEKDAMTAIHREKIPVIGSGTLLPAVNAGANPYVFYLDSGVAGQAGALAEFAANRFRAAGSRAVLVVGADGLSRAAEATVREKLAEAQWPGEQETVAAGIASLLQDHAPVDVVFLLCPEPDMLQTMDVLPRGSRTVFLIPGGFATEPVLRKLRTLGNSGFLAVPFLPSDVTPEASSLYAHLAAAYKLPKDHLHAQYTALCDAAILVEGLKRAGRDLSRVDLKESIEGLYDFSCGFGQAVTFSSSRHAGITQYHIVELKGTA